ncbi:MAG: CPBP family intramembrane glutamic endopeptidase [Pseudomonadota bacterium]
MAPFAFYIARARRRRGIWRSLLGLTLISITYLITTFAALLLLETDELSSVHFESVDMFIQDGLGAVFWELEDRFRNSDNALIAMILLGFSGTWLGTWIVVRRLHRRSFASVFGPPGTRSLSGFMTGAAFWALMFVTFSAIHTAVLGLPEGGQPGTRPEVWILWIAPMVVLTFVQAAGEEIVFRGYLMQQLAARSSSWLIWALLPSILFGLGHHDGTEIGHLYVFAAMLTGLMLSVVVWRAGSLWPAIGWHVSNNIYALCIVSSDPDFGPVALWYYPDVDLAELLKIDCVASTILLLAVLSPAGRIFDARR